MSEITWLLTIVLVGLWVLGSFLMRREVTTMNLSVPPLTVIGATFASILTIIGYARRHHASSRQLITIGYVIMFVTSLYTVISTGNVSSPFVVLWLLISIFPAIFGLAVFIPVTLIANTYLAYLYLYSIVTSEELLLFAIAVEVPLITSLLIWRKGIKRTPADDAASDQTFKALAKELSQVANKSEIVINAIADGVVAVDGQGIVQLINPAAQQIIGWGKQDALRLDYRSVLQLFNQKNETVTDSLDPIQQCLHTNETVETDELILATTSGKKLMVNLLVSPLGQIGAGAIVVFRDITDQHKEERQQAEFISTASHEMRTPVAAIEGYIGLALNPATATIDEKAKAYLGKAHESAQHLGRLFQDLLDISKAEDGRLDSEPRVVDLVAFVRDITLSFQHLAGQKGLILLYKPDTVNSGDQRVTPAYFVRVDPDHIREVTANLVENAIKYTKTGDVTVDLTGDDDHATITITDTGIGIPSEDISHLFQKFYRVDNTDTREIGGTGLGLYLCRRLVETMGGRIWVTSDYGKGSTFHIELPRMSNLDAIREIEAAANQPEITKLHATASFLASEEEAAAVKLATTVPVTPTTAADPAPTPPPVAAPTPAAAVPLAPASPVVAPPATPAPVTRVQTASAPPQPTATVVSPPVPTERTAPPLTTPAPRPAAPATHSPATSAPELPEVAL